MSTMAFLDFRSTWSDLIRELHAGEEPIHRRPTAEQILQEVTEEMGLVEPDLMVLTEQQSRPDGRVVYDKFAVRRR